MSYWNFHCFSILLLLRRKFCCVSCSYKCVFSMVERPLIHHCQLVACYRGFLPCSMSVCGSEYWDERQTLHCITVGKVKLKLSISTIIIEGKACSIGPSDLSLESPQRSWKQFFSISFSKNLQRTMKEMFCAKRDEHDDDFNKNEKHLLH